MSSGKYKEKLGPPSIDLAGLRIWIHSRQFPEADDYWDGNWLNVTACCGAKGAEVWASGPFIHLSELAGWMNACEKIYGSLVGEANLDCIEPELKVRLNAEELGRISMIVEITPDH